MNIVNKFDKELDYDWIDNLIQQNYGLIRCNTIKTILNDRFNIYVIREKGFIVYSELLGNTTTLDILCVDEKCRKEGIGKLLLTALPPGPVFLQTHKNNVSANKFYEKNGFRWDGDGPEVNFYLKE